MERRFNPLDLSDNAQGHQICLPVEFVQALAVANSLQEVLDTVSQWLYQLFDAERASITLRDDADFLKIYSIRGNKAIPLDFRVPIANTLVGRAFTEKTVLICDELDKSTELDCIMLAQHGMQTCMDAPLLYGDVCLGTLNVAHKKSSYYSELHAIELQCLANWIGLNISLRLQLKELEYLASTDHLTGAANRRVFTQKIRQAITEFHENGQSFFFGLMDIDHFKMLNDQFGHSAGDYVLQRIVAISETMMTSPGKFFRIGGEEFAIIFPEQSEYEPLRFFNDIREAIALAAMDYDGIPISVSVSIGFTAMHIHDNTPESLLRRSDKALYQAKLAGRNRVLMFNSAQA
ncbi:sensor domain-containing diguanylate cyclase [Shewanella mangrovisoli]|uniref:sensor domain-containing diguanylate cyclase n=1 Tax=Shewanella mangrovisoli TaxID=2864211 RepID=UPI0035BB2FF7